MTPTKKQKNSESSNQTIQDLQTFTLNQIPTAVAYFNPDLQIIMTNENFIHFFQLENQIILGKNVFQTIQEYELAKVFSPLEDILSQKKRHHKFFKLELSHTAPIHILCHYIPNVDANSVLQGILILIYEESSISYYVDELNAMRSNECASSTLLIKQLSQGIVHDFNNILGVINGFADLSLENLDEPNFIQSNLNGILESINKAKKLMHHLLIYTGTEKQELREWNVADLVNHIHNHISTNENFSATTAIQLEHPDFFCQVNDKNIVLMINNLCDFLHTQNTDTNNEINVELSDIELNTPKPQSFDLAPGKYLKITIWCNTKIYDAETLPRIFEPYFRNKPQEKSLGLSLSTAESIVLQHHGIIECKYIKDKGTEFEIMLPVQSNRTASLTLPKKLHVLFIDDEDYLVKIAGQTLTKIGYEFTGFSQASHALEVFAANPKAYDVVIVDYNMPRLRGDKFAAEIHSINPTVPIIICSGFIDDFSLARPKAKGVMKFIQKPLHTDDLKNAIEEVLRNKG